MIQPGFMSTLNSSSFRFSALSAKPLRIKARLAAVMWALCASAIATFATLPAAAHATAWQQLPAIVNAVGDAQVSPEGLELILPLVAEDGSSVPLTVKAGPGQRITRLSVFATQNPTPEIAIFEFGPEVPTLNLSTRIRLSDSQPVVAVAHTEDGRVLLAHRQVRVTTSGCIAPAKSDPSSEMKARVRVPKQWKAGTAEEIVTMISHPMITGLAEDAQGNTPEQRIIKSFEITLNDRPILRSTFFRSLAANPYLRFDAAPIEPGELNFKWTESSGQVVEETESISVS